MFWLLYVGIVCGLFYAFPVTMIIFCVSSALFLGVCVYKAPLVEDDRYA